MGPLVDQRAPGSFADTLQRDPEAWALRINSAWRRSLESVIETGRLLIDAKANLVERGQWQRMVGDLLDFSPDTAQRLMAIARDQRLTDAAHVRFLPRSYSTLHELTKLSDEEFQRGLAEKIICPDMERKDVEILRPTQHRSPRDMHDAYTSDSSDGQGSPVVDNPVDPTALSLQQGLDTSSIPGTADASLRGEGTGAASVANPEQQPASAPPVAPGPSEAILPGGGLSIAHSRVEPAESLDFFPTPPWATRAFVEHVLVHLERRNHCQFQVCWEPACGEGHMAEPLKEYFREVVASDVKDYGYGDHTVDFLQCERLARKYDADWIITNPPFGDKMDQFILKALHLAGTGVAMLVRLQCLETVGRYEKIFRDTPPTLISFFVERVPMHKGRWEPDGDTMTAYIWLTWIKGAQPQAPFWIPPGCRERLTRPDDAARFGVRSEAAE